MDAANHGTGKTFFEEYPLFIETSATTKDPKKLGVRYEALIVANRDLFKGGTVLDLASHDGRWSFAALKNGAAFAYGIEWKKRLVDAARRNFDAYGVPSTTYKFVTGDMFQEIDKIDRKVDCVFCFGIFYHIVSHMILLKKITELSAKHLIIDTNISAIEAPVVEWRPEGKGSGSLVGHPSRSGIMAMLDHHGWTAREFDWKGSGLIDNTDYPFYRIGKRITIIASR